MMKKILFLLILTGLFAFAQPEIASALSAKDLTRKARPGSETDDTSKKSIKKSTSPRDPTYRINRPRPKQVTPQPATPQPVTVQKTNPNDNKSVAAEGAESEKKGPKWKKPAMFAVIGIGALFFLRWVFN